MRVAILKADSDSFDFKEDFDYTLDSLQKVVGGYIEAMTIRFDGSRRLTVWLNEEGKLNGLPPNFALVKDGELLDIIMGDIIITSCDEEGETVGLNDEELAYIKNKFDFETGVIYGHMWIERLLAV